MERMMQPLTSLSLSWSRRVSKELTMTFNGHLTNPLNAPEAVSIVLEAQIEADERLC
jgi:hypothetical protein